jgi:hypothetical protein
MLLSLYVCTCQSSFPPMKRELNKVEQGGSSFPKSPKAWPLLGYEAAYSAFPIGDLLLMMGRKLIFFIITLVLSYWFHMLLDNQVRRPEFCSSSLRWFDVFLLPTASIEHYFSTRHDNFLIWNLIYRSTFYLK